MILEMIGKFNFTFNNFLYINLSLNHFLLPLLGFKNQSPNTFKFIDVSLMPFIPNFQPDS